MNRDLIFKFTSVDGLQHKSTQQISPIVIPESRWLASTPQMSQPNHEWFFSSLHCHHCPVAPISLCCSMVWRHPSPEGGPILGWVPRPLILWFFSGYSGQNSVLPFSGFGDEGFPSLSHPASCYTFFLGHTGPPNPSHTSFSTSNCTFIFHLTHGSCESRGFKCFLIRLWPTNTLCVIKLLNEFITHHLFV